jgi:phosphopantothenoylcysteine decarboxylase
VKVLLGVSGSVAAIRASALTRALISAGNEVKVVITESAKYFCSGWGGGVLVYEDSHEWSGEYKLHESRVLHIDLREWADVFLIAPLTANTLGKLANGLADNLLTSVARAWDMNKFVFLAPAMNTNMWEHPATNEHLLKLVKWNPSLVIIPPIKKMLACGTEGMGAMAEIETIVETVMTVAPPKGEADVHAGYR